MTLREIVAIYIAQMCTPQSRQDSSICSALGSLTVIFADELFVSSPTFNDSSHLYFVKYVEFNVLSVIIGVLR